MPLLTQVHNLLRTMHMSIRTEKAYCQWIERFLRFQKERAGEWQHPVTMGSDEVKQFLTHLASERNVSASTQNQALSALLFLFTKVLNVPIELNAVRAKRPERLPVVLSVEEVRRLLLELPEGEIRLMAGLMYVAGMRVMEVCRLRVKDLNFDRQQIIVRDGKGEKDRVVPLPQRLSAELLRQLEKVKTLHLADLEAGELAGFGCHMRFLASIPKLAIHCPGKMYFQRGTLVLIRARAKQPKANVKPKSPLPSNCDGTTCTKTMFKSLWQQQNAQA